MLEELWNEEESNKHDPIKLVKIKGMLQRIMNKFIKMEKNFTVTDQHIVDILTLLNNWFNSYKECVLDRYSKIFDFFLILVAKIYKCKIFDYYSKMSVKKNSLF